MKPSSDNVKRRTLYELINNSRSTADERLWAAEMLLTLGSPPDTVKKAIETIRDVTKDPLASPDSMWKAKSLLRRYGANLV